jgi:hypothetical protein
VRVLSALLLLCLTGSVAYAASITASAHVNAAANPPAGKKAVFVKGDYTLDEGEKVEKIEATFYVKLGDGKLDPKGSVTDPNFAKGKYQTTDFVADQGTAYTVISRLHLVGVSQPKEAITNITP